jgi:hypothetical protein
MGSAPQIAHLERDSSTIASRHCLTPSALPPSAVPRVWEGLECGNFAPTGARFDQHPPGVLSMNSAGWCRLASWRWPFHAPWECQDLQTPRAIGGSSGRTASCRAPGSSSVPEVCVGSRRRSAGDAVYQRSTYVVVTTPIRQGVGSRGWGAVSSGGRAERWAGGAGLASGWLRRGCIRGRARVRVWRVAEVL